MRMKVFVFLLAAVLAGSPAEAATITGVVSDATGAVLPGARVVLRDVATGKEIAVQAGADGRYQLEAASVGTFLVIASHRGFSDAVRTVVIVRADQKIDVPLPLELAGLRAEASVTAARADREIREIPLHVETLTADAVAQSNPLSTGDALAAVVNITPVGNGPFGVRPRLRGLDSTRLLVLVDGERLNTARQATDRTGAEVGLISTDVISRLEIVNGAGTLMYGSDALAGTINIVTNEPAFTDTRRFLYGFDGYYSSNEQGRRGTLTMGVTAPRYAVRVQGGAERFDNYRSGGFDVEDTRPLFASGALRQLDSVADANLGVSFRAFPDPFNAPFVRTDDEVLNSQARGNFVNASSVVALNERQTLRLRYQRRRMNDVGFPDFVDPFFFNATSLPHSNLDRVSGRYEVRAVTPWLASVSLTAYYQRTERLLDNVLPVQFAAPTPGVRFPISVLRLNIHSETEQRVWTPGVDIQGVLVPAERHLLTAGLTVYRDRSSDNRRTTTTTTMVGLVVPGPTGPGPVVFPEPIVLGAPAVDEPVRVPDATFRDLGLFVQDEWRLRPSVLVIAGVRADFYRIATDPTPGYDIAAVVGGATPAIDPATLPDPNGATYTRTALTGDVGVLLNAGGRINPFVRVGRSYRHPNLEEMLFAGPATIGSIAPNVLVKPETGTNLDLGAKFRAGRITGGAYVFVNSYDDFIAQDLVVAATPRGPLAQATNYADVRIRGLEVSVEAPVALRSGVLSLAGAAAFTHGTIVRGVDPLTGQSLDGTPADNITPVKILGAARFTESRGRWWVEYGVRGQTEVTRVAETLLQSPFLIAQDLLSLDGFVLHRIGAGWSLTRVRDRLRLTFAVENLSNRFYREHFQFAPARGRSVTLGLSVGSF
ncbi:MAG TPA: TonB-dependent receptor [Vicinamibacterales bacterium]|nr:TonB-dependent receptor [Vicinamibacterales bacterium]